MKGSQLLEVKEQLPELWSKGCAFIIVCAQSDLTWLPLLDGGRKL